MHTFFFHRPLLLPVLAAGLSCGTLVADEAALTSQLASGTPAERDAARQTLLAVLMLPVFGLKAGLFSYNFV